MQANISKKQAGVTNFTFDKIDFKPKLIRRDGEGHCILIKGKVTKSIICNKHKGTQVHKRYTTTTKISKSHIDPHTVIVGTSVSHYQ